MPTPPTFTTGQVLTASQMNTIGMHKIVPTGGINVTIDSTGTVTPSGSPTGIDIIGCFNGNYDNYLMTVSGIDCSVGDTTFQMYLGTYTGTDNYANLRYYNLSTGAGNLAVSNYGLAYVGVTGGYDDTNFTCWFMNPYKAGVRTTWHAQGFGWTSQYDSAGVVAVTTSFNRVVLFPASGTMTGGQIRFYGMRN